MTVDQDVSRNGLGGRVSGDRAADRRRGRGPRDQQQGGQERGGRDVTCAPHENHHSAALAGEQVLDGARIAIDPRGTDRYRGRVSVDAGKPQSMPSCALGMAPGKLILFGEHSVVYGQPALGIALGRGVKVTLSAGTGRIEAHLAGGAPLPELSGPATPASLVRAALGERAAALDVELELGLPPLAGLGSSAALAVATLRALHALDDVSPPIEQTLEEAIAVEDVAHGRSSGLDPAICLYGGVVEFSRKEGKDRAPVLNVRRLSPALSFHVVIGVHGHHGGTADRVRRVGALRESMPQAFDAAMKTLGQVAKAGTRALVRGELEAAGHALDLAHGVLSGFGLVSEEVEALVRITRRAGALGAKMSGAGGRGGAFFGLAPDFQAAQQIREELEKNGALSWVETAAE